MPGKKRKSDQTESVKAKVESTDDKRMKTSSDFLLLNDQASTEQDYQTIFHTLANRLINHHELVVDQKHRFRLCELEFYFYHSTRHSDTFAHRHPEQQHHARWYFHRQGTSPTASYKAGTYKGLDITFSSADGPSFGGILIRSIQNKETGQCYEGSCLVVDAILNVCQIPTIKELVEVQLKSNLDVFHDNPMIYLQASTATSVEALIASPRVGLTLKVPSLERERFLFRPYRFTPEDYYPSKMKMTIVLALAATKYFQANTTDTTFTQYADDLVTQTKSRSATVTSNLQDLQKGYDLDTSKKTSPLVDFYKKNFSTSDLARAYGIWLRKYRTNNPSAI